MIQKNMDQLIPELAEATLAKITKEEILDGLRDVMRSQKAVEAHSAHLQHLGSFLYNALVAKVGPIEAPRLDLDIVLEFNPMHDEDEEMAV